MAEVCFVPRFAGYSKKDPAYRFLAIRERFSVQWGLPDCSDSGDLPCQTMEMGGCPYKVFGIVMKRLVLGREWVPKRLKAIRFARIRLPGGWWILRGS